MVGLSGQIKWRKSGSRCRQFFSNFYLHRNCCESYLFTKHIFNFFLTRYSSCLIRTIPTLWQSAAIFFMAVEGSNDQLGEYCEIFGTKIILIILIEFLINHLNTTFIYILKDKRKSTTFLPFQKKMLDHVNTDLFTPQ